MVTGPRDLSDRAPGLGPLSPAGPPQPVDEARGEVMALLSDEAKALVLGELLDMRQAARRAGGELLVKWMDGAIRRVARGLYRYEMRRSEPLSRLDFDVTTGKVPL